MASRLMLGKTCLHYFAAVFILVCLTPISCFARYDRDDFNFHSYRPATYTGWYTGQPCDDIDIDHVVSLKDAYESGASTWSNKRKAVFANDRLNHVASCASVNRSKGSSTPKDVIRKANDGRGVEFTFIDRCSYIEKYYKVKIKYDLSFEKNSMKYFRECGVAKK